MAFIILDQDCFDNSFNHSNARTKNRQKYSQHMKKIPLDIKIQIRSATDFLIEETNN